MKPKHADIGLIYLAILLLMVYYLAGCFPNRAPTDPNFKAKDVRRPAVEHHVPLKDATGVSRSTTITIWFDELMDETSVRDNFEVWPDAQVDSIQTIAVALQEPDIMYVGRVSQGVFKSTDGGESWRWMSVVTPRMTVRDLAIDPSNPEVVYAATDSGVFKSQDGGASWEPVNTGLTDLSIMAIAVDPTNTNVVYVTTRRKGVFKSEDGGLSWVPKNKGVRTGRPLFDLAIDPSNSDILYAATQGNFILKSTDGAENWTRLRAGLLTRDFYVLAVHPLNGNIVYAGSVSEGIYRSEDGGKTWTDISSNLENLAIRSIALDPSDTNVVILGTAGGIFKTTNAGASWFPLGNEWTSAGVRALALHPLNAELIFAGAPDGVYKSSDGGISWEKRTKLLLDNILVAGAFQFEPWQDTTVVIAPIDSVTNDTTVIFPYIYSRALEAWRTGGRRGDPPVEINPKATKMIFTPAQLLLPNWKYRVRIKGAFESDRETWRGGVGAKDIHGNSLEVDYNFSFTTGKD